MPIPQSNLPDFSKVFTTRITCILKQQEGILKPYYQVWIIYFSQKLYEMNRYAYISYKCLYFVYLYVCMHLFKIKILFMFMSFQFQFKFQFELQFHLHVLYVDIKCLFPRNSQNNPFRKLVHTYTHNNLYIHTHIIHTYINIRMLQTKQNFC